MFGERQRDKEESKKVSLVGNIGKGKVWEVKENMEYVYRPKRKSLGEIRIGDREGSRGGRKRAQVGSP